ncbi:DUF4396 domain-containing protein [Micromonospora sp. CPCC 205558]|uniref:DUF4396 domain-containing protein n=1 Tax=Micromonospora sp. CPCC 205558 TaxID=3122403 RepID=UPI002FF110AA
MQQMVLMSLSWIAIGVGVVSSASIVVDIRVGRYRQLLKNEEFVWPVTGLYLGPAAVVAYRRWIRPHSPRWQQRHGRPPKKPRQLAVLTGVCQCGAHCALGVVLGEVVVFAGDIKLAGDTLWASYVSDYLGAVVVGVTFRYFTSVRRGRHRIWDAIVTVAKADLLTVTAFEMALFVWLALSHHVIVPEPPLNPTTPAFWFFTQIGLASGFIAAWPATAWLIRRGIRVEPRRAQPR